MSDAYPTQDPAMGYGLDVEAAEVLDQDDDLQETADYRGPGEGDAVIMAWARAM